MFRYLVSIKSYKLEKRETSILRRNEVGGVILYGKNILTAEQTRKLIISIKSVKNSLTVAVDEEGGIVSRFSHLFPSLSQAYLGVQSFQESSSPLTLDTGHFYHERAHFLKSLGIEMNLAPVADIAFNEFSTLFKRSYGNNPQKVADLVGLCVQQQRKESLTSCVKHFPGLGRAKTDSHQKTPKIDISLENWKSQEAIPFKAAINVGVEAVLVGHCLYPKIDSSVSSLSSTWINQILRKDLNFGGLVIIDDIRMGGFPLKEEREIKATFDRLEIDFVIDTDYLEKC